MKKIVILGGGLAGLAAADRLAGKFDVVLLEKNSCLGGLASSFKINGKWIPRFYHHIISHNSWTKAYLKRFDLLDSCSWKKIRISVGINEKIHHPTTPIGLLDFDLISFQAKFRLGLFGIYTMLMNPARIPATMGAEEWLKRLAGKELTEKFFKKLYGENKFNIPLNDISAKQFAYRLKEGEAYNKFSYPAKGLHLMIEGLEKSIKSKGGRIVKNCKLQSINVASKQLRFSNKTINADAIINTIPLPEFLKIAKDLPKDYASRLSKVRYCPAVGVAFATKDFLSKDYWTNFFDERIHVLVQHSILCDKYGQKINWCLRYGGSEKDLNLSDDKIKKEYIAVVKRYFPKAKILWAKVFREKYAEPIYDRHYSSYDISASPVEGFYHAGIAVTYPKIRNMNSVLESGITAANKTISYFSQ